MGALPDTCPGVVKLFWNALLPITCKAIDRVIMKPQQANWPSLAEMGALNTTMLIQTLVWLDFHHPETILPLLNDLSDQQLNVLRLLTLSLGLEHFSSCLAKSKLSPLSVNQKDLFHQLLKCLKTKPDYYLLRPETCTVLSPLFAASGLTVDDMKTLASERDDRQRLPLQTLLEEHLDCADADPFFDLDESRFQTWFEFLVQHTPKEALPECLGCLLRSKEPKNINYYWALLLFQRAGCDLLKVPLNITSNPHSEQWISDLPVRDYTNDPTTIHELLTYLQQHPDTLCDPDKTDRMITRLKLSPAFQAVTLLAMSAAERRALIARWHQDPARMKSLFLDRYFSLEQHYTGPWLPFMVILQHDLPTVTADADAAEVLETRVDQSMAGLQDREQLASLPPGLVTDWQNAEQLDIYGRSIHIRKKRKHASNEPSDPCSFRLKFRKKQDNTAPEPWADFTREQAVLSVLDGGKLPLQLESGLLKAGGVYRLPEARRLLSRACFIPEPLQQPFLDSVHIEPQGHTFVQVLQDTPATRHYHHYPYLINPELGLTRDSAFAGIRLYCRDSGRLWRAGIKSPDAMGVFHTQSGSKTWNPLPGYTLRRQHLFCTSTLCAWNAQIPDIAHAPAGARDFQGVMAMDKLPGDIYGERRLDWNHPQDVRRARLVELAKQFYGATLNWLRVRHDLDELDHNDPEHLHSLASELMTLYVDLFSQAFGGTNEFWTDTFRQRLPDETLKQAVRECLYWCSPQHPYVTDIHTGRFPSEVYPEHQHRDLQLLSHDLYQDGFKSHPDVVGANLGLTNMGQMVLQHLSGIFWFGVMEGVYTIQSEKNKDLSGSE
ncbi:hypothetical protein [Endozoicomonas sp. SCSIO W0465]|uniref:hypothetical protein n=1 Tax=Endozoicomonas sp. SCSIO W0465 TaxID=2918516 RepID=UPI002074F8AD|nr:hypothetical protein [Endozoicomonas sp. SCSIO W0465]USE36981.1 hypothetical protein MJO57_01700 [Endozoicomonas sp. SCSIO W0465]